MVDEVHKERKLLSLLFRIVPRCWLFLVLWCCTRFSNAAFWTSQGPSNGCRLSPTVLYEAPSANHEDGVRLNKAFKASHSRRQADALILDGRVRVNGEYPESMGVRLFRGDVVTLDGKQVNWERLTLNDDHTKSSLKNGGKNGGTVHTYLKYWKPRGIECTTDRSVKRNIMDALGKIPGVSDRLWPMGRLDKDSTGLILITSDGPTTERVLRSEFEKWKTYLVETDKRASNEMMQKLSNGVRIQSHTSRDGKTKVEWITTRSAIVQRGPDVKKYPTQLVFQICEGKNRQIRRMCEAEGLRVIRLHRTNFAGISLSGCSKPGTWTFLTNDEIRLLKDS